MSIRIKVDARGFTSREELEGLTTEKTLSEEQEEEEFKRIVQLGKDILDNKSDNLFKYNSSIEDLAASIDTTAPSLANAIWDFIVLTDSSYEDKKNMFLQRIEKAKENG
ncbi:MAG: hypothetical protein Fur0024_4410 [Patescibacteria group bacterium]